MGTGSQSRLVDGRLANHRPLKVTVTCGRKFHSDHLAAALLGRDALERVITANPRFAYRRHALPANRVVHTFPFYLPGLVAGRWKLPQSIRMSLDWGASRRFDRAASKCLGQPDVVLAWAWSALETFRVAKQAGAQTVLEECGSANAHQEAILTEEHERLGMARRVQVSQVVIDNERAECEEADVILCPSQYVADSFAMYGVRPEKCLVIPYASNPRFAVEKDSPSVDKLRILYVGSIGPRKGVVYLLRALELLPKDRFECTLIGRVESEFESVFRKYRSRVQHVESVPHELMPEQFQRASVFVLPTLDEGMAYVIMEALASGTPVITTAHSGAVGTVVDGMNGYVVPIRDHEAIAERLERLIQSPDLLQELGQNARASATSWSWDNYVDRLLNTLTERLDRRS